jgi:DNA-binding CsgD family transcriptional regulator
MIVVDHALVVIAADPLAWRLVNQCGLALPGDLPPALKSRLGAWAISDTSLEMTFEPQPGILVHATRLGGDDDFIGLQVSTVCVRDEMAVARRRFGLSRREVDVVQLLLHGESACEIAQRLGIGEYTVGDYLKRVFLKTRVRNRAQMIAKVLGWRGEFAGADTPGYAQGSFS